MTYFSDKELKCRCGCGMLPKQEFRDLLELIRDDYGQEINVSSKGGCARCPKFNRKIGGARKSRHMLGIAVDLIRTEALLVFLIDNADKYNIWIEDPKSTPMHIHIDTTYRPVGRIFLP